MDDRSSGISRSRGSFRRLRLKSRASPLNKGCEHRYSEAMPEIPTDHKPGWSKGNFRSFRSQVRQPPRKRFRQPRCWNPFGGQATKGWSLWPFLPPAGLRRQRRLHWLPHSQRPVWAASPEPESRKYQASQCQTLPRKIQQSLSTAVAGNIDRATRSWADKRPLGGMQPERKGTGPTVEE